MKKSILAVLGVVLLIAAAPAVAAPPHGGGHSGGHSGGHMGGHSGGHSGGHFRGTASSSHFHGGWGGWHGGGWHGGGWHGGGWGWGWGGWYGYGYPYWGGYYGPGAYYSNEVGAAVSGWTIVDTGVSPDEARLFLDGRYIGTADDFDGFPDYLYLRGGHFRLEFRLDGYETKTVDVDARPGAKINVNDKLKKIPGAKHYGSYDTPQVEGGLQRFFAKQSDGSDAVVQPDSESDAPGNGEWGRDGYGNPHPSDAQRPPEDRPAPPPSDDWRDRPSGSGGTAVRPGSPARSTRLSIHAEPADAAVYLDDRFVGTADEVSGQLRGLRVSPGRHSVTVSRPGFKDRTVAVEVEGGRTEEVEIDLEH